MNILPKSESNEEKNKIFIQEDIYFNASSDNKLLLTLRSFLLFCIILSLATFADILFLPVSILQTKTNDAYLILDGNRINSSEMDYEHFGEYSNDLLCRIETNEKKFSVSAHYCKCFRAEETIKLYSSYMMKFFLGANSPACKNIKPYINIKGWFMLVPATILIFGIIGLMFKRTDQMITFAALNIILMATLFFLLMLY